MSHIEFDTSELDALAIDFSKAPGRIQRSAPKALEVAANRIKQTLKRDAAGHNYLSGLPRVSYDKLSPLHYEIGFDKVGQGHLANIAVYGSVNNAPVMRSPRVHAEREMPHLQAALADDAEDAVLGGDRRDRR